MEDLLIAWTARAAVGCFLLRLLLMQNRRDRLATPSEIAVWAAGGLLLLAHTVFAFQFQHHWSHAAAYAHTARQTFEMTGWDWGGGLSLNYLTVALWVADVLVLIRARWRQVPPPRWWTGLVITWIGFIVVNATLVFGPRWWWGLGAAFGAAVAFLKRSHRVSD